MIHNDAQTVVKKQFILCHVMQPNGLSFSVCYTKLRFLQLHLYLKKKLMVFSIPQKDAGYGCISREVKPIIKR